MFYPQSNFHSQSVGYPQGLGYPPGLGYPQGLAYPQGLGQGLGYPQSFGYSQANLGPQGFPGASNTIPFANTLYGYPQLTATFPSFAQGLPQMSTWQHPALQQAQHAQQQAQQQAALQQQAMLQLLATQLGQPFTPQHVQGANGFPGLANGAAQSVGSWQQPQANPEINPALQAQSQQQLLQRLAQYHQSVAQQLAQLAVQQATAGAGSPYTGQFIPNQFVASSGQYIPTQAGANFVPGITMH